MHIRTKADIHNTHTERVFVDERKHEKKKHPNIYKYNEVQKKYSVKYLLRHINIFQSQKSLFINS